VSRFSGPQGPGALKVHRERKRVEAEERQKLHTLASEKSTTKKRRRGKRGKS